MIRKAWKEGENWNLSIRMLVYLFVFFLFYFPFGRQKLAVYVSDGVPEVLVGDPGRFRQIITNLVGNSIKVCSWFIHLLTLSDVS